MGVRVSLVSLRACTIRQKRHEHFLPEERERVGSLSKSDEKLLVPPVPLKWSTIFPH